MDAGHSVQAVIRHIAAGLQVRHERIHPREALLERGFHRYLCQARHAANRHAHARHVECAVKERFFRTNQVSAADTRHREAFGEAVDRHNVLRVLFRELH